MVPKGYADTKLKNPKETTGPGGIVFHLALVLGRVPRQRAAQVLG